ncbi:MAG: helix-turn-helix domain-containing protein [Syntrophus sp. (in: bacteria)]
MKTETFNPQMGSGNKVERIYRILLSRKRKNLTAYRIAKDAEVSWSWAYRVLSDLDREGLIVGTTVKDPKEVFMKWVARKDNRRFREYHLQNPEEVLRNAGMDYVFTGYFAENLIGHYLFPRYREIYVKRQDANKWHEHLSENGYVGKGNFRMIIADEHVFFERDQINEWPVVSIQQLIVDLYRTGSECSEAADILLRRAYLDGPTL